MLNYIAIYNIISYIMTQKQDIIDLKKSINELTATVNILVDKIDNLTSSVEIRDQQIFYLENKLNEIEQYSKKTNIIISSSTDFLNKSDNKKSEFINFVKNQLNIDIDPYDVVAIHELPNKNKDIYKTIVKFHFHETKSKIFKNITKLKDTNIYINDHLTKYNSEIFYKARNLLKDSKIKYCWTVNGITFIKKTESSEKEKILNLSDFNSIL